MTSDQNTSAAGLGQGPSAAPRRDLSSILGPRPRPHARPTPPVDEPPPTGVQDDQPVPPDEDHEGTEAASTSPKTKKKSGARPSTKPAPDPGPARKVSTAADAALKVDRVVYLPDDITVRLAADCARQRLTRTQMVLTALEATHQDLPELIEASLAPKVTHGALFDVVTPATRRDQPAKRQVFITPTRQQLDIIDSLRESTGARDRSHLIMVALDAHLT